MNKLQFVVSKALQVLQERVKREGWSTVDLAGKLGISQPTASRLIRGERGPSLGLGSRIQQELGIETAWWAVPAELPPAATGTDDKAGG